MKHWVLSIFLLFFVVEVFSIFPKRRGTQTAQPPSTSFVTGLINVHTQLSDGSGSISELSQLAESLGHSFVVFSDQDSLEGKQLGLEKRYGAVDAFIEIETKTPSGDLLLFFSHTPWEGLKPLELSRLGYDLFLGNKKGSGAFVSISHPSHIKKPWTQLELFPDGIELFNFDSLFIRKLYTQPLEFLGLALLYPLNPFVASLRLIQPYQRDFTMWDNMNTLGSQHFGIWSSHFTEKLHLDFLNLHWPRAKDIFSLASNVVFLKGPLADTFEKRKKQIYQSIREGRLAISFDALHPFSGNDLTIRCGDLEFKTGDVISQNPSSCVVYVKLPPDLQYSSKVRLLRNGEIVKEVVSTEKEILFPLKETGSYRAEIWLRPHSFFWILLRKWVPYVVYNPFRLS